MHLHDAVIHGTATFCNTHLEGILTIGNSNNLFYAFSNIAESNVNEVMGTLVVDENLYVSGRIFCNGIQWSAVNSMELHDAIIYGTTTFCNTHIEGLLVIGDSNNLYYAFSNIPDSNVNEVMGTLVVDENLYVSGRIFCNGIQWSAADSMHLHDAVIHGTTTFCNTHLDGILTIGNSNNVYYAYSNIPDSNLNEVQGTLLVDENLYVSGRIFCNGIQWSAVNSFQMHDALIYGTATFCNTLVEGILQIGSSNNVYHAYSNVPNKNVNEILGALVVDEDLYVSGRIYCNGLKWSAVNNYVMENGIIQGNTTFCNCHINGILDIGNPGGYVAYSNVTNCNYNQVYGAMVVEEDLYVGGRILCNGFAVTTCNILNYICQDLNVTGTFVSHSNSFFQSNATFKRDVDFEGNGGYVTFKTSNVNFNSNVNFRGGLKLFHSYALQPNWVIGLSNSTPLVADLLFESINGTKVTFTDNFTSEVLNFTGKHRCIATSNIDFDNVGEHLGKIVIATGDYVDLNGRPTIAIDEAIPIINIATKSNDPRVFGVISGVEDDQNTRKYKLGNLQFEQNKQEEDIRVIVNSVGEGAILVCNINGNLVNGDLISSSEVPGLGMKQNDDIIRSFTVAKITCDCEFDLHSTKYNCWEFVYQGQSYRKALVGCVYKC
jgi:hypothetical protein